MKTIAQKIEDRFDPCVMTDGLRFSRLCRRLAYSVARDEIGNVAAYVFSDDSVIHIVGDIWGTAETLDAGSR